MLAAMADLGGVSGGEGPVRNFLLEKLAGFAGEVKVDTMGNLLVRKGLNSGRNGVMLSAHMDEVGLMIMSIQTSGLLKFKPVGGIDSRVLVAKRVRIGNEGLPGVIGSKPIHLQKANEQIKPFDEETLYIDAGFQSKEEAEKKIEIGALVVFESHCIALGKGFYRGKAFDDRVGCLILLELLLEDNGLSFSAAFTVQEEVGTRGAVVAAYTLEPEAALVVETTAAADTPEVKEDFAGPALGAGPAISIMDRTIIVSRKMREQLVNAAEKAGVPYQFRRSTSAGTDAGAISLSRSGVETGVLAVPCRYIHSPHSIIKKSDLEAAKETVRTWLQSRQ